MSLTEDEAHVLLDVIGVWKSQPVLQRDGSLARPWTEYDSDPEENPKDPKTAGEGWRALLDSAEIKLIAILDKAPGPVSPDVILVPDTGQFRITRVTYDADGLASDGTWCSAETPCPARSHGIECGHR